MDKALGYVEEHFDQFVDSLESLLRIPSISTDSAYKKDVGGAADWLVEELKRVGIAEARTYATDGHPIVYAEHKTAGATKTVLVYGHYDVQPPDPLELWTSPPFEPVRKNGTLYARGACDDKGQVFMHVKAVEAYLKTIGSLPVNLKMLIEGEEESGSKNLVPFIKAHKELLSADVVLISDTAMFAEGVPSITIGLRGMAYVELILEGPNRDLHSGVYGGGVANPVNALARMISALHDDKHRITVDGFYDDVRALSKEERKEFADLPFDTDSWKASIGIREARTEDGFSIHEAITARPTLDVNGIWGGYQGEGAKTVLPSIAGAKISTRLVPDQTSKDITEKLRSHFERHAPPTMKLTFKNLHGGEPVLVDTSSPAMAAASDAMQAVYGKKPYLTREGGSIPVVADFKKILGLDTILFGFGLNSDAIHSPNEHFGLDRFRQGIESIIRFHKIYGSG